VTFTWIDLAVVVLVLLSAVIGLVRGLVREVFSLVVWASALVLALLFSPRVAGYLAPLIGNDSLQYVGAFTCVFIATLVVGALIQWMMARLIDGTGLTGTDRVLGFVFGSARGALVCIVVLIAMRPFGEDETWWQASVIVPALLDFEEEILVLLDATADIAGDLVGAGGDLDQNPESTRGAQ
jgi:membrane protein required for colicin V production